MYIYALFNFTHISLTVIKVYLITPLWLTNMSYKPKHVYFYVIRSLLL